MYDSLYFHIDVNSAFLSWTAVDKLKTNPDYDLRLIPSIIGGDQSNRHGIVLAKSIPAKPYGIQTAEPIASALKKCPNLVIEKPNHSLYSKYSHDLMQLLASYCPNLEQLSIDECFLDFTMFANDYESPVAAATIIKDDVFKKFGFTVNVGISTKKVLAKMASDFKKPNLVHTLFPSEIKEKMWPLPINELYMCGKAASATLQKLGINTIGDLAKADIDIITSHLKSHGRLLWEYANGIDDSTLSSSHAPLKGIGHSTTLATDVETYEAACPILLHLCDKVAVRLRKAGNLAGMINVEIKYADFTSVSHQTQLNPPTDNSAQLYKTACGLYQKLWNGTPVRLIGVRTSKLTDVNEPTQLDFFHIIEHNTISDKQKRLDAAIDSIRNKFGESAVVRGSSVKKHHKAEESSK
jgi:DNA polymerase IV